MKLRKYTIENLKEAVRSSTSCAQVLKLLGVTPAGGNYQVLAKALKHFSIDTSHFKGQSWNKDRKFGFKRPISLYLSNDFPITSHRLRKRLIAEKIFEPICSWCGLSSWLEQPISLELDHINGNHLDNSLSNLRLLCPNCHSLTPTFRGKNKRKNST